MTALRDDEAGAAWRKLAALALAVATIGLPINELVGYALLLGLTVVIFSGEVSARSDAWIAAVGIVVVAVAGQAWLSPPRRSDDAVRTWPVHASSA